MADEVQQSTAFTGSANASSYEAALALAQAIANDNMVAALGPDAVQGLSEEKSKILGDKPPFSYQVTFTINAYPAPAPEPVPATPEPAPEPEPTKEPDPTAPPEEDPFEKARQDAEERYNEPGPTEADVPPPDDGPKEETPKPTAAAPAATPASQPVKATSSVTPSVGLPGRRTHNPLGDFSSYTYNISLYIINPDSFNTYSSGGKLVPKDFQLIAQSGGINNDSSVNPNKRADGFDLDYYIDNLNITTAISGKESRFAGNSYEFTFNIFEPFGFTFPTKLVKAAQKVQADSKIKRTVNSHATALQCQYLLTIRFYGYDKNGKLVTGTDYPQADTNRTDSQCVFERSFPIQIYGFDFKLDSKMVTYNIKAKMTSEQVALGSMRGTVKGQQTITASTVGEALTGGTTSGIKGLTQLLNEQQDEWMQKDSEGKSKIGVKDVYKIVFDKNTGIDTASLNGDLTARTPLAPVKSSADSNVAKSESAKAAAVNAAVRSITIKDGTPITQVIDQVITQSDFIGNAMLAQEVEEVQPVKNTDSTYEVNKPAALSWYNISPQVTKILDFDTVRNTYACEITYVIQKYEIPYVRSTSHGYTSKYYGPHKRYSYYYTGKNTEILSYDQQYNLLFFNASAASNKAGVKNSGDGAPNQPMSSTNSDSTGRMSGWFEQVNSVKSFLYSPADQLNAKIDILGDPDYLMSSVGNGVNMALQKFYGPDFTINPNSGQVFIEVDFRQAEDYKHKDGLLDISKDGDIIFWDYPDELKTKIKGVSYMLTQVVSSFSKGKFVQSLKGVVPPFANQKKPEAAKPTGSTSAAAATTSDPNQSDAETARLAAKNADAATKTSSDTKPTEGTSSVPSTNTSKPPELPPYQDPIPDVNVSTTIGGATVATDYRSGGFAYAVVTLPSGKVLPNVDGWGDSQWDYEITKADPSSADYSALVVLKSNTAAISSLVYAAKTNADTNNKAREEYDAKQRAANPAPAVTYSTVADDDSGSGSNSKSNSSDGGRE